MTELTGLTAMTVDFVKSLVLVLVGLVPFIWWLRLRKKSSWRTIPAAKNFEWSEVPPRPIRPFVGKKSFRPNMGISNISKTPEEWLLIENSYKDITEAKSQIVEENEQQSILAFGNDRTTLAVRELYLIVFDFMRQRYPQYFKIKGGKMHNLINGNIFPVNPVGIPSKQLLKYLAANVEEDFLLLLKDNPDNENEEYILRANITGFASGFDPSHSHNRPILSIHGPVPQYESRLKVSMARFFNRLSPSDMWVRHNWTVQTHKLLFTTNGTHAYDGELVEKVNYDEIDFAESAFLRVERQVLTRLPVLRALIMTVRTYLTPIQQIKDEGLAKDLVYGIDNLPEDLARYKRREAWGEAVKTFLNL